MKKNKRKKDFRDYLNYFLIIVLLICFIVIGKQNYPRNSQKEEKIPVNIVGIEKDNIFNQISANDVLKKINEGNILVLFALTNSKNTNYYANALNDVAKELEIDNIYYYDISTDRKNSNGTYGLIVETLNGLLEQDDQGKLNIYAPSFLIMKDNEILLFDQMERLKGDTKEEDYWNEFNTNLKKSYFKAGLNNYLKEE